MFTVKKYGFETGWQRAVRYAVASGCRATGRNAAAFVPFGSAKRPV